MPKVADPIRPTPPLFALLVDPRIEVVPELVATDSDWRHWMQARDANTSLVRLDLGRQRYLIYSRRFAVVNERATAMSGAFGVTVQVMGPAVFLNLSVREMLAAKRAAS